MLTERALRFLRYMPDQQFEILDSTIPNEDLSALQDWISMWCGC